MYRSKWVQVAVAGLSAGVVVAGVGFVVLRPGAPSGPPHRSAPQPAITGGPSVQLVSFGDNCASVLSQLQRQALAEVGPWGLDSRSGSFPVDGIAGSGTASSGWAGPPGTLRAISAPAAGSMADQATPGISALGGTAAGSYSTTNDQDPAADEPDLAKTDGRLLVTLRSQGSEVLEVTSVAGGPPRIDGFVRLPAAALGASGLLLDGSYAVVLAQTLGSASPTDLSGTMIEQAYVIGLADPAHPSLVRTLSLPGAEVGARLISGQVVLVLSSAPDLPFAAPSGPDGEATAAAANRSVIESSTISQWLPPVTESPGGAAWPADCAGVLHAPSTPVQSSISVVSFDPASAAPGAETTVFGGAGNTVYASATSVYVAESLAPAVSAPPAEGLAPGAPEPDRARSGGSLSGGVPGLTDTPSAAGSTLVAAFSLADPSHPRYEGSAEVPGGLIGQYAMSEYDGDLRVATTVGQPTPPLGEGSAPTVLSDNLITVLAPAGGHLSTIGSIGDLGRGEKIYGVRFEGPLAYVVTFRQTDPLYVVDLSHPGQPRLDGSLTLDGYSSFLEPLHPGLLLGVGQSVDANERPTGTQLSVFDVSNPSAPVLRSQVELPGVYSGVGYDPHQLLWWPATRVLALPVTGGATQPVDDVWVLTAADQLQLVAQITQPETAGANPGPAGDLYACPAVSVPVRSAYSGGPVAVGPIVPGCGAGYGIERSLVVGNLLYTVSEQGIMATDMTGWTRAAWLPYSG
jgi:hypothetical protein